MNMTSRWFALLVSTGATMALLVSSNACGDDDSNSSSSSTDNTSSSSGMGGSGGGGAAGGAGGGGGGTGGMMTTVNCSPPEGMPGGLTLTEVTSVPGSPLLVTSVPGDNERLFIMEQEGRIQLLRNGQLSVFLDISNKVLSMNELGLLGMAFHPNYVENGRFFVHFSNSSGDTVIAEYARDANNPDVADPNPVVEPLLTLSQPFPNHNGGSIEFNPMDGFLYIGLGDGGAADDPLDSGQDTSTLLGTLLRLDVSDTSGNPPYAIPAGNLTSGAPEIYDWGLRNPYRFSFDPCTGDRYIGDVGQDCYEEIDVATVADGGQNFGWKVMEGQHCRPANNNCNLLPPNDCDDTGMTPAAVEYLHQQGASPQCDSVTGGVVYRGSAIPWLRGAYLYSDFCDGRTWMFRWSNGTVSDQQEITQQLGSSGINISGFGLDNDGEVYIASFGGSVYRIDPN